MTDPWRLPNRGAHDGLQKSVAGERTSTKSAAREALVDERLQPGLQLIVLRDRGPWRGTSVAARPQPTRTWLRPRDDADAVPEARDLLHGAPNVVEFRQDWAAVGGDEARIVVAQEFLDALRIDDFVAPRPRQALRDVGRWLLPVLSPPPSPVIRRVSRALWRSTIAILHWRPVLHVGKQLHIAPLQVLEVSLGYQPVGSRNLVWMALLGEGAVLSRHDVRWRANHDMDALEDLLRWHALRPATYRRRWRLGHLGIRYCHKRYLACLIERLLKRCLE